VDRCSISLMATHQLAPVYVGFPIACQPDRSVARDGYRAAKCHFSGASSDRQQVTRWL